MSAADATFFYADPADFDGDRVRLQEDEAHHAYRVLRLRPGDEVQVVDGVGGWYRVRLEGGGPPSTSGVILERRMGVGEPDTYLHLAVASMKSRSRFDSLIEKCTELGASRITVLETERTDRARFDEARAARVARAAMKQCKRSRIPLLEGPASFHDFLTSARASLRLICHEDARSGPLASAVSNEDRDLAVLVGPESGFTASEVELAVRAGFVPVHLGVRRLRTETAAMTVCVATLLH